MAAESRHVQKARNVPKEGYQMDFKPFGIHVSFKEFKSLSFLPVSFQHQVSDLLDKLTRGHVDYDASKRISLQRNSTYSLRSRNLHLFEVPSTRIKKTDEQFVVRAPLLANALVKETGISILEEPAVFKSRIRCYALTLVEQFSMTTCSRFLFCIREPSKLTRL